MSVPHETLPPSLVAVYRAIRRAYYHSRLTQAQASARAQVCERTTAKVLAGQPVAAASLFAVAEAFDVPISVP